MKTHGETPIPRFAILLLVLGCAASSAGASDWARFRGPNGSGVSDTVGLPVEFGPDRNLIWKTPLPPGHSSPILSDQYVFLTAFEGEDLLTLCLDRSQGKIVWRQRSPRDRHDEVDRRNSPASPSPVTDGANVYVFFPDFGLLSYDLQGNERWRLPLGPFNNIYGMGASPILSDDLLLLACDQSTDSFLIAVGKDDGRVRWKTSRPEAKSGHSTPILWQPEAAAAQLILPGSFLLTSYSLETGERNWWTRGLSFEMKSTPVLDGTTVYVNGYGSPMNQPGKHLKIEPFEAVCAKHDANGDGRLSEEEADEDTKPLFPFVDLNRDGLLDADDWGYYRAAMASTNGVLAIALGGKGDTTDSSVRWTYHRAVPQLPSPLLYRGVLYMVNDGGIVTSFQPASGEVIARGRLKGAVDQYYASPVAADDKVFMVSEGGKVSVLAPDGSLEVLAVNDLGEPSYATPALADGRIYIRTTSALYCFGNTQPAKPEPRPPGR
jgi:outer membrane protein assembly factor BamB